MGRVPGMLRWEMEGRSKSPVNQPSRHIHTCLPFCFNHHGPRSNYAPKGRKHVPVDMCIAHLNPCNNTLYTLNIAMHHRRPPATFVTSIPLMTATKTPHLLVSDSETPNQRSEGEDQPECRHDGTEEIKRWHRIQKKVRTSGSSLLCMLLKLLMLVSLRQAHAQQPTAGSTTCSNSGTSGGTSSDSEDSDGMNPQHLTLSRSSLMAQWGEASSGKAAVNVVKELVEERRDDSQSKYQPQTDNVINKARDLCARIRHQAKVKQREERKHILLQRYVGMDCPGSFPCLFSTFQCWHSERPSLLFLPFPCSPSFTNLRTDQTKSS